jgi:hypothetical protein
MTKEIPFEALNAIHVRPIFIAYYMAVLTNDSRPPQNPQLPHGLPTYLKGVRATKPRFEVSEKAFQALIQYTEKRPDMNMSCMFEYFPLAKICSVANDATAYARAPYGNVLNIIRWTEDTEENLKYARDAAREISNIVLKGNTELTSANNTAYGNYGALRRLNLNYLNAEFKCIKTC